MADLTWTDPGAFAVAEGVWRIPLPLPTDALRAVNVYAIDTGDGLVVVDGGWALVESAEALTRALASIEFGPRDVREFLVTHVHRDHYTQAVAWRRAYGSLVALGEGERETVEHLIAFLGGDEPYDDSHLMRWGAHSLVHQLRALRDGDRDPTDWELPDRWLTDGLTVPAGRRVLEAISTPGHTRGHLVFHDAAAALLFAGDHVLPHITPSIGVERPVRKAALRDFLSSLARVRALPDAVVLPAHGPVAPSVHARVDELLAFHDQRLSDTAAAVAGGAGSAYEVAGVLRWTRRLHSFDSLDLGNQLLAVGETAAHLEALVARGWLREDLVDGVERHTAV